MKRRPTSRSDTRAGTKAEAEAEAEAASLAPAGRAIAAAALRHWEPRRLAYNAVLVAVVAAVFATHWQTFVQRASLDLALLLFLLAVAANIAFCAAYPADLFVQWSGPRDACRHARRVLFVVGTLFAAVLARFIARGMVGAA